MPFSIRSRNFAGNFTSAVSPSAHEQGPFVTYLEVNDYVHVVDYILSDCFC